MKTFHALDFASLPKEELWTEKNKKIKLIFEDGTVECYWRDAVLSSYCWKLHRENPQHLRLTSNLMVERPITKKSLENKWNEILYSIKDDWERFGFTHEYISTVIFKEINKLFNDSCKFLTRYTTSSTARELREIIHHPVMEDIYERMVAAPEDSRIHRLLDKLYKEATEFLTNHPDMISNGFARSFRMGLIDKRQFQQVILARGYVEDIDNHQFRTPVRSGYGRGIHDVLWTAQESRGASLALLATKDPVQTSDYLNRRLQIMAAVIRNRYKEDCGTNETIPWRVEKSDLKSLSGVNRVDEMGNIHEITEDDKDLIGKVIYIRAAPICHNLHKYGVCETCLGRISNYVTPTYSIGHISIIGALGAFVQLSLSAKHLIVSRDQVIFVLDESTARYIKFPNKDNQNDLVLQPKIFANGREVHFVFSTDDIKFIGDITKGISSEDIQVSSASFIDTASVQIENTAGDVLVDVLTVSDIGRKSHLSREFIDYILTEPSMVDIARKSIKVNMEKWDVKLPIFNIPYRITGVKDFMDQFEKTIKSGSVKYGFDAQTPAGIGDMMRLCYNIVHSQVDIPVSHLGVMVASLLIRDKENMDYRLPLPGGKREFDTMLNIYGYRSITQTMAFERRSIYLRKPAMLLSQLRANHPFDQIYFPETGDMWKDVKEVKIRGLYPVDILPDV